MDDSEAAVKSTEDQQQPQPPTISVPLSLDDSNSATVLQKSNVSTPLSSYEQQLQEQRALDKSNSDNANEKYEDSTFIFQEEEFESDQFHAGAFVGKYRRVASLDSLKEQLREYSKKLKEQLYVIINRDYKDFITIATKLDGVDDRVDLLRKPLVDLRLDLAALHDGMVASKQAIIDKFKHKQEIATRRKLLEASLMCMDQLDLAEEVIASTTSFGNKNDGNSKPSLIPDGHGNNKHDKNNNDDNRKSNKKRRSLLTALRLSERGNKKGSSGAISYAKARDAFECSEYERAANSLSKALKCVETLQSANNQPPSTSSSSTLATMQSFVGKVEQRARKGVETLVLKIKNRLEDMLAIAVSACNERREREKLQAEGDIDAYSSSNNALPEFPDRSFCHCLRALIVLGRGGTAERVVADSIVLPLARSTLSQGRVDGTGGRGSFAGLKDSLNSIIADIKFSLLAPFRLAESMSSDAEDQIIPSVDFLINGIWYPVTDHIANKFPNIFSVGIADTFYRAYSAVEDFTVDVSRLLDDDTSNGADRNATSTPSKGVKGRLRSHPSILAFHSRWKLDLYYQLRSQEIISRVEQGCATLFDIKGIPKEPVKMVYDRAKLTIDEEIISELTIELDIDQFKCTALKVLLIEMATSLHVNVIVPSHVSKFFTLCVQLLLKLQTAVAGIVNHSGEKEKPSNTNTNDNLNSDDLDKKDNSKNTEQSHVEKAATWSNEDLVVLTSDLDTLARWIERFFINYCDRILPYTKLSPVAIPTPPYYTTSPVSRLLTSQAQSINLLLKAVFNKITFQLCNECKVSLQAVKSIAGKYRMTNKPAPEIASSYVKNILTPVKSFTDKHSLFIPPCISSPGWIIDCTEGVTSLYLQEVKLLMETAKQMDTALQRRSKLRSTNTGTTEGASGSGDGKLGDSEKISLQILLDVLAYGEELKALFVNIDDSIAYKGLLDEVADARNLMK